MKLISIITNANGQFVVVQHPQTSGIIPVVLSVVAVGFAIYFLWTHQWKLVLLPVLGLLILVGLPSLIGEYPTYRLVINQQNHEIVSEAIKQDKVVTTTTTPTSDVASAEMQFNRGARTIVLVSKDGRQIFPLGEQQLQNEPDQYVILNALRQAIGQAPASPQ